MKLNEEFLVSGKTIAKMCDVSERRVQQLVKQGIIDRVSYGRYNLLKVATQYIRHLQNQGNTERGDLQTEKTRLTHHQANIESLKELQLKGELIPDYVIVEYGSGMVAAFRAKMLSLSTKLRNRFTSIPKEQAEEIQHLIDEALSELGNDGIPPEIRKRIHKNIRSRNAAA